MQHLIIGAGPAGVVAAETLRKVDPDADIAIIGDEPEPPYSRMAIPYYLSDNIDESGSYLREPNKHFKAQNIEVVQQRVDKLDAAKKQITLADGSTRDYDKLLIATGSHPISPPIPGLDLPQVHSCWTLEDARNIIKLAQSGSNVVLIGAGFIGCIILEALVKRGVNLTVVETGNRMVPRMLDDKAGGLLETWCKSQGIDVHTSCSVESVSEAGDNQVEVALSDGGKLSAALVITATGVKANTDLLEGSGIDTDQGVLVNKRMQSSDADVYAAGDVAQGVDFSTGNQEVQAIQPTAVDHGRIAALNMAGRGDEHQGTLNMNILDTVGLVSCSFGLWMGVDGGDQSELYNADEFQYINLQFDGNFLVGFVAECRKLASGAAGETDLTGAFALDAPELEDDHVAAVRVGPGPVVPLQLVNANVALGHLESGTLGVLALDGQPLLIHAGEPRPDRLRREEIIEAHVRERPGAALSLIVVVYEDDVLVADLDRRTFAAVLGQDPMCVVVARRTDHGDEAVTAVTDVGPEDDPLGFDAELLAGKVRIPGVLARSREVLGADERVVDLLGAVVTERVAVVR